MRIGLLADTHVPNSFQKLPRQIAEAFSGVDLILHAGDIDVLEVLDGLEGIAPVLCARGNRDFTLPEDPRLKEAHVVAVDGLRIGLSHDLPLPEEPPWRTLETVMEQRFGGPVNLIVFGDTHVATIETYKGVLLVNPGSPTLPNNLTPRLGTVALLDIVAGRPKARIVQLTPGSNYELGHQREN